MAALHDGANGQAGVLAAGPAPQDTGSVLEAERIANNAAMGTSEPVIPSSLFQVGGAGRIVRKKPLEPRKRFRERKIISIENVHSQPPIRFTPTLDVVGVGVKRIGTFCSVIIIRYKTIYPVCKST